jgi:hypothetical protein
VRRYTWENGAWEREHSGVCRRFPTVHVEHHGGAGGARASRTVR